MAHIFKPSSARKLSNIVLHLLKEHINITLFSALPINGPEPGVDYNNFKSEEISPSRLTKGHAYGNLKEEATSQYDRHSRRTRALFQSWRNRSWMSPSCGVSVHRPLTWVFHQSPLFTFSTIQTFVFPFFLIFLFAFISHKINFTFGQKAEEKKNP